MSARDHTSDWVVAIIGCSIGAFLMQHSLNNTHTVFDNEKASVTCYSAPSGNEIQKAIDEAHDAGLAEVSIHGLCYRVSTPIRLYSGMTLHGNGAILAGYFSSREAFFTAEDSAHDMTVDSFMLWDVVNLEERSA